MDRTCPYGVDALDLRLAAMSEDDLLVLGDSLRGGRTRADRVTALIAACYSGPAGFGADRLSIVDRMAALFGVALALGPWPARFVASCDSCGGGNALTVAADEFAYAPAAGHDVAVGGARLMQPNGRHEARLEAGQPVALSDLVIDGATDALDETEGWAALEAAAPRWSADLPYRCTHCAAEARFWFDPLDWIADHLGALVREVHVIARAYGWTEAQILALPRPRRLAYLALIEGEGASA